MQAIAKVVDSDADFRNRVAASVDESSVGRAGWLWLSRPEGWEAELAELEAEMRATAAAAEEQRQEHRAKRKLAAAQDAAEKAATIAKQASEEAEQLRVQLAEERSRNAELEQESTRLRDTSAALQDERNQAVRELKDVEARLAERSAEHNRAKERIRVLEQEAVEGGQSPRNSPAAPSKSEADRTTQLDHEAVARTLAAAVRSAEAVAVSLARLGEQLSSNQEATRPSSDAPPSPAASDDPLRPSEASDAAGAGVPATVRRTPLRLPGGVLDDTVEAADHLIRSAGVLVLVDGYNVTMAGWPELAVAEQRAKLVRSLDGLAARTGADLEVIFDGAEVEPLHVAPPTPRDVRVRFSPPQVEADDVLLDLLAQTPTARPVVVVSSDNRVRNGARQQGANLLHSRQFVELLA